MPTRPPLHRPTGQRTKRQRKSEADQRRGSARARGYDWRWQKARDAYLRSNPLCVMCKAKGIITAAGVVDHIVKHNGDPVLFWDQGNWQSLCKPHHDREKQRQDQAGGG